MSSRARRVINPGSVVSFPWDGAARSTSPREALAQPSENTAAQVAEAEREGYARGYAEGEAAGAESTREGSEVLLRRLTQTLQELMTLRTDMIRQTERQTVELALAIAKRIVHREVSLDHDLLIAMTRVALERLGGSANVTVRLHPDEYEAVGGARVAETVGANVTVVADPRIERGGCRVDSDMGTMDVGIDAQIEEVARALLGEDQPETLSKVA